MGPSGRSVSGDRLRQVFGQAGGLHGGAEGEQGSDEHEGSPFDGGVDAVVGEHAGDDDEQSAQNTSHGDVSHVRSRQPYGEGENGQRHQHARPGKDDPRTLRENDEVGGFFEVGHASAGHADHEYVAGLDSLVAKPSSQARALAPDAEHETAEAVAESHGRNREAAAGEGGAGDQFENGRPLVFGL